MTNTEKSETIAYNLDAIATMRERQAKAVITGAECPNCGGGVNPTILNHFGHCMKCQNATIGR